MSPQKLDVSAVSQITHDKPGTYMQDKQEITKQQTLGNSSLYLPPLPAENQIVLHKEMFMNPNSNNKLIVLSEETLDFGFCDYNK